MENGLVLRNLERKFGGVVAVKDLTFSVEAGSRVGIIGPNGAGKTTTFNMISGVLKPTAGSVEFEGEQIGGLKSHQISKRGIGRTFQIVRVFGGLSVYEHVLTGVIARKLSFAPNVEQEQEVESILELIGLAKFRDVAAANLTVAAKKRLELATVLATKPKLLLLDELMAGLTFVEIDECMELLRKLNEEIGITLIVVEHVMKAIMELCEIIIVLDYGEKIAEGSPREVANNKRVIEAYLGTEA